MIKTTEEVLSISTVTVDPQVQRPLDETKVKGIVRDFDGRVLGQGTVSRRPDGTYVVLDGQHRIEAMQRRRALDLEAPGTLKCVVFHGLSREEEAQIFLGLNNTNPPRWLDKFFVSAVAGDESTLAIIGFASKHGWKIAGSTGVGRITAVATLARIYRYSLQVEAEPNLVDVTLEVITDAWGLEGAGTKGALIEGLARLLGEYGEQVDLSRLKLKLKQYANGPFGLLQQYETIGRIHKIRLTMAVAFAVVQAYNHGKQTKLLPTWTRRT